MSEKTIKPLIVLPSQLKQVVGFGRVTAWRLEQDPNSGFPKRRKITTGGSVGYLYSELEEYVNNLQVVDPSEGGAPDE